jgi:hypothetical protein
VVGDHTGIRRVVFFNFLDKLKWKEGRVDCKATMAGEGNGWV